MNSAHQYILFSLDEGQYAIQLSAVSRVVRAVEVTPLPEGPETILGVINVGGLIVPAVNLRKIFGLPQREIDLNDQFIIANTSHRKVALAVDKVTEVVESLDKKIVKSEEILPQLTYVEALSKLKGVIILILDLDRLLSLDEDNTPDALVERESRCWKA